MTDIFISYARVDRDRIAKFAAALESHGYKIWWDRHLAAGAEFGRETNLRLNQAKVVLVAWSQASIDSMWVADEATVGRTKHILIPVCIDRVDPPLGFRQVQTIDLADWSGDVSAPLFDELCAALDQKLCRSEAVPDIGSAAPPEQGLVVGAAAEPRRFFGDRGRAKLAVGALIVLALAAVGFAAFSPRGVMAPSKGVSATQFDDETRKALTAIGNSPRSEDRAAYNSFVSGDQRGALDILEKLAQDLEKSGANDAAAEAYTRAGAVAILVDQGRGLVDRRKAMRLKPESMTAYLGLFFDVFLLQGYDSAMRLATEMEARPDLSLQMRGFVRATMAIIETDGSGDFTKAENRIAEIRGMRNGSDDAVLLASEHWASSQLEWKRDNLKAAAAENRLAREQAPRLAPDFPRLFDVMDARISFALGDWRSTFESGLERLSERQRDGNFLPMPLLSATCISGLYLNEVERAKPVCEALTGQQSTSGEVMTRIYSAMLLGAQGKDALAMAELDAANALADMPGDTISAFLLEAKAYLLGKARDLDGAEGATAALSSLLAMRPSLAPSRRSNQAGAFRLLGQWAIDAGEPRRACKPLASARSLYLELGADAGVAAVDELFAKGNCTAE